MARCVPQSGFFNRGAGCPSLQTLALGIKAVDTRVLAIVQVDVAQTVRLVHWKLHLMVVRIRRCQVARKCA